MATPSSHDLSEQRKYWRSVGTITASSYKGEIVTKIVVLGGGYGGLRAIEKLVDIADIELTLIDRNRFHYMQTEVYGYIAGTKDIDEITIDLESWCRGFSRPVRFIRGSVTGLDTRSKVVRLEEATLSYDLLIVATGSRTRFPSSIEGLRRYGFGVKRLDRAFGFRHRFEELVEQKLEGDERPVHIVVAGAGLSGVEVAAEMAYMLQRYRKSIGRRGERIAISLLDACDRILPGLHPFLVESSQKRLCDLGVRIETHAFIERVDEHRIHLRDREPMPYTFMIFTGGIVANSDFLPDSFARNETGQLIVTPTLTLEGESDIFAIGDVADLLDPKGRPLPPTAQTAEKSAEYVAKIIGDRLEGRETRKPFRGRMDGFFIALGGRYGAAELFGYRFKGRSAYYAKRLITFIYFLGIHLRANAGYKVRR